MSEEEEEFAIFWSYDQVSGFVTQAAVGDTIDFTVTGLFYEGNTDCEEMEDQFTYTVMGAIPVEGGYTTTGLQVVQTLHAYGAYGLEPDADATPVWIRVTEAGPYGAEVGRCATQ